MNRREIFLAAGLTISGLGIVQQSTGAQRAKGELAADYARAVACDAQQAAGKACTNEQLLSSIIRQRNETSRSDGKTLISVGAIVMLGAVL